MEGKPYPILCLWIYLRSPSEDLGNELILLSPSSNVSGLILEPTDVPAGSRSKSVALDEVADYHRGWTHVAVNLPGFRKVGDTGVRAHQHIHRVETALKEPGNARYHDKFRMGTTNLFFVSERWIPPRGVFGRWLWGTSARQYKPTLWIESTA